MATFDDLRELYIKWSDRHNKYRSDSLQLILGLAIGFCQYIGAPETYQDSDKSTKRYVFPLEATRDAEGKIHYNEPKHITDVLTLDENDYWIAGIGVVLDRRENAYPKTHFQFNIRFILRERICELHIGDEAEGKFEFDLDNPDNVKSAYDYMVSNMRKVLSLQPWSTMEKTLIGFELPRTQEL